MATTTPLPQREPPRRSRRLQGQEPLQLKFPMTEVVERVNKPPSPLHVFVSLQALCMCMCMCMLSLQQMASFTDHCEELYDLPQTLGAREKQLLDDLTHLQKLWKGLVKT